MQVAVDMSKDERDDIRTEFTDASREIHGVMTIVCHKICTAYSVLIVKTLKMRYTGWKYRECGPCKTNATTVTSAMGQYIVLNVRQWRKFVYETGLNNSVDQACIGSQNSGYMYFQNIKPGN